MKKLSLFIFATLVLISNQSLSQTVSKSELFLKLFDVNSSSKLEVDELVSAFNITSLGECVRQITPKEYVKEENVVHVWLFLFEYGRPVGFSNFIQFHFYTTQSHKGLAVDAQLVEKALHVMADEGCGL